MSTPLRLHSLLEGNLQEAALLQPSTLLSAAAGVNVKCWHEGVLTWPTSSGSPMRIMGVRLRMRFMPASSLATAARTSVMMLPGPIAFTRTPCGAIASAIDLRRVRTQKGSTRHKNMQC